MVETLIEQIIGFRSVIHTTLRELCAWDMGAEDMKGEVAPMAAFCIRLNNS